MPRHFSLCAVPSGEDLTGAVTHDPFDARSPPSRWRSDEISYPGQVESRGGERKYPVDPIASAMSGLTESANGLDPAEYLFYSFAFSLT